MVEVVLARADRRQVWKPLLPAAAATSLALWSGASMGGDTWVPAILCVVVFGGIYTGRAVLWSWLGDLTADVSGLTYRPRRGEAFRISWRDINYAHLAEGAPVLPQWHFAKLRGPLPVLHLHLRSELRHAWTSDCVQAPATPGLEGLGPHTDRSSSATWELSLLVRPRDLPVVEQRLVTAFEDAGVRLDGPSMQTRRPTPPWREADGQDASG